MNLLTPTAGGRLAKVVVVTALLLGTTAAPAFAAGGTTSQSTSQALKINLLNGTAAIALSNPPTSSYNDGTTTSVVNTGAPSVSALGSENFLSAGALSEYTEADNNGSSYACAGTVQPGGIVTLGAQKKACVNSGNGTGGVTIDLSNLPGAGSALASVADIKLNLDSVTAFATENASDVASGKAAVTGGSLSIYLLGGLTPITIPINIPAAPNSNLLTSILNGITGNAALSLVSDQLSNGLKSVLSLTSNYQPSLLPGGAAQPFSVTGIHISLLNDSGAVADISRVTVGPNATTPAGPLFPVKGLPIAAIGFLVAGAIIVPWYRRRRRNLRPVA